MRALSQGVEVQGCRVRRPPKGPARLRGMLRSPTTTIHRVPVRACAHTVQVDARSSEERSPPFGLLYQLEALRNVAGDCQLDMAAAHVKLTIAPPT